MSLSPKTVYKITDAIHTLERHKGDVFANRSTGVLDRIVWQNSMNMYRKYLQHADVKV